jgi:hypothetical protein
VVRKARLARHHKLGFTQATLSLVVDKHRARHVLLGCLQFVKLRLIYREANRRVKKAVVTDADAFAWKHAEVTEHLQQASRLR